jgi:hypothetical protein
LLPFPRWLRRSSQPIPDGCAVAASSSSLILVRWRLCSGSRPRIPNLRGPEGIPETHVGIVPDLSGWQKKKIA